MRLSSGAVVGNALVNRFRRVYSAEEMDIKADGLPFGSGQQRGIQRLCQRCHIGIALGVAGPLSIMCNVNLE